MGVVGEAVDRTVWREELVAMREQQPVRAREARDDAIAERGRIDGLAA